MLKPPALKYCMCAILQNGFQLTEEGVLLHRPDYSAEAVWGRNIINHLLIIYSLIMSSSTYRCKEACGLRLELFANSRIAWPKKWHSLCDESCPSKTVFGQHLCPAEAGTAHPCGHAASLTDGPECNPARKSVCAMSSQLWLESFPRMLHLLRLPSKNGQLPCFQMALINL